MLQNSLLPMNVNEEITDSWFTCEQLMACVRSIGKGAMHFVGLAKMGKTKYTVSGRKKNAAELIAAYERGRGKNCRKHKCRYIQLSGNLGDIPVRIFLIKYGRNSTWNVLLTTDTHTPMSFVKAFEVYQVRWDIEVINKETKQYLGLGGYQGCDFNSQIADATLVTLHIPSWPWKSGSQNIKLWANSFRTWRTISWHSRYGNESLPVSNEFFAF